MAGRVLLVVRRTVWGLAGAAALTLNTGAPSAFAQADAFASKPVRIVIGSAPGGGLDATARAISEKLMVALGQPIIIDNRPGAAVPWTGSGINSTNC